MRPIIKTPLLLLTLLSALLTAMLAATEINAQPAIFVRPRGIFLAGIDVFRPVTGKLGAHSGVGMSVFGEAAIQAGYFAVAVRFGSARAFTKKDFLPFDQGYQFIYFTAAPRFYYSPFRRELLSFYLQPEIGLQVYQSNTLVTVTGNNSLQGLAGGSVGATYILGIIALGAQISVQYLWGLKSLMVTGGLSVGVSATFE